MLRSVFQIFKSIPSEVKRSEKTFIWFRFEVKQSEKNIFRFALKRNKKIRSKMKRNEKFSKAKQSENTVH
jgi:hypothetical protein